MSTGVRDAPSPIDLGKLGEDTACRELERQGYAILARRYRSRHGEIDIVCDDGGTLVFVEVKARRSKRCGTAAEAITFRKRRKIAAMALDYLSHQPRGAPCRFDVVAIDSMGTSAQTVRVIRNAFLAYER